MSGRGGNSYSEEELKAALFLTISVSTTFVLTWGELRLQRYGHKVL